MLAKKYYRVPVYEGNHVSAAYFYETAAGLFDLQYGWGKYTSGMHESLDEARADFQSHLEQEHASKGDGVQVALGPPVEVNWEEVRSASPHYGVALPAEV